MVHVVWCFRSSMKLGPGAVINAVPSYQKESKLLLFLIKNTIIIFHCCVCDLNIVIFCLYTWKIIV